MYKSSQCEAAVLHHRDIIEDHKSLDSVIFVVCAHHSVQHTLGGGFAGVQGHAGLLQQLLVHHLDLGLGLDAFLQAVEALLWRQLERVDLSCGHVQDVDHLEERMNRDS